MSLPKWLVVGLLAANCAYGQSQTGSITGNVLDGQTGRPVAGASLSIAGQSGELSRVDADGRFTLTVPAGTYTVTFAAPDYHDVQLTDIVVQPGQTTEASTVMSNVAFVTSIDVVESATAVGATAQAMLIEQKLAPVVSDSLSHEELSSGTSSDAAGALEKVTGVSVVGDGFVYVRGLGERYSAAQLNGALMATTEPEKRVVPLDLFPATLIENMRIMKSYSPDLPAEFAGGLVQLQTIDFPAQKMLNVSFKGSFNTATTFDPFFTYPGGSHDFFGFDDGSRSLPSSIPAGQRLISGRFTPAELQSFGRAFADNWEPTLVDSARAPLDWSAVGGGTFGRFGVVGALTFGNKPHLQSETQRYLREGAGAPVIFSEYEDFREYTEEAKLGSVFNVSVRLTPNHNLAIRNTLTHDTEKSAREFSGYDGGTDQNLSAQRLRWIERKTFSNSVEGNHTFPSWNNSLIHWQFTHSLSTRDEPDLREIVRSELSNGQSIFSSVGSSGVRFFSNLEDRIYEPQLDYSTWFFKGGVSALLKTGFRATVRRRDFSARRFRFIPQDTTTLDLTLPSNQLFAPENIRPDGFQIVEFTRGTDSYTADMNIYAGYGMVDLALGSRWRLTGGVRFEGSRQEVTTIDNFIPQATPVIATLENTDPVPAVNVIYSLTANQNLRASYSRTLSRPDFRELSPFDFNDVLGGFVTQGNDQLKRATISNYDLRWEHFSTGNQLIAASFFAKIFTDPIEQVIKPSNDLRETFVNAEGARNFGFELEFRRALGNFAPKLGPWSVASNFTFVDSKVDISAADAAILTSDSRPLVGQSRYIANVITEFNKPQWRSTARFFVNYVSRRLSDVGAFRLPDIYQEGNTTLDFSYELSLLESGRSRVKFEAENLTDAPHRWKQGDIVQREYRTGRNFQIGMTYSFF
jgi:outer membrane receptor protein involved in Fe transport